MKILFLDGVPTDDSGLFVHGRPTAANLACRGIAQGLHAELGCDFTCFGFQITKVFPRMHKFIVWPHCCRYADGLKVWMLPGINVALMREFIQSVMTFTAVVFWALCHLSDRQQRVVMTYNLAFPPFESVLLACKLTGCKYVPVLHDMGLVLYGGGSFLRRTYYRMAEQRILCYLPKVAGAAVICEAIRERYLPHNKTMLLDGGITDEVVARLFPLKREKPSTKVTFIMAGLLEDYNGVQLILDAMKRIKDPHVCIQFAGVGGKIAAIQEAMAQDPRIAYLGSLNHERLFRYYQAADCILNIRVTGEIDTSLYFPSKFLEALTVGRLVLSTCTGHLERVYGEHCLLLKEETAEALAARFEEIARMSVQARDAIGEKARAFMLRDHTWKSQMKKFVTWVEAV